VPTRRRPWTRRADGGHNAAAAISPARVAQELRKLSSERAAGGVKPDEYEHRFSRMITELRDRRIDGSRAEILATLTPLLQEGVVSAEDWRRLTRQLGLA
jgi:hypothetical protein